MYVVSSDGTMKTVSSLGDRCRFISAIWYSYSKSLTARSPRMSSSRLDGLREIDEQSVEARDLDALLVRRAAARISSTRSSAVNSGCLGRVARDGDDEPIDELAGSA